MSLDRRTGQRMRTPRSPPGSRSTWSLAGSRAPASVGRGAIQHSPPSRPVTSQRPLTSVVQPESRSGLLTLSVAPGTGSPPGATASSFSLAPAASWTSMTSSRSPSLRVAGSHRGWSKRSATGSSCTVARNLPLPVVCARRSPDRSRTSAPATGAPLASVTVPRTDLPGPTTTSPASLSSPPRSSSRTTGGRPSTENRTAACARGCWYPMENRPSDEVKVFRPNGMPRTSKRAGGAGGSPGSATSSRPRRTRSRSTVSTTPRCPPVTSRTCRVPAWPTPCAWSR